MSPLVDEHVREVGREVRELAELHLELARTEMREGTSHFVRGLFVIGFGVTVSVLVLVAFGISLFFLLDEWLTHAGAAVAVALVYTAVSVLALGMGWRWVRGVSSVMLPRTRAMLVELVKWKDESRNS